MDKDEFKVVKEMIVTIALVVIALIFLFGSFYTVPAGHRAVLLTFGRPSLDAKVEGLHPKFPIVQKAMIMSVQTQKYEADASSASHDLQIVHTKVAVNYHIDPAMVPIIYRDVGIGYEGIIIQPAVQEVVKATTAQFTAEELITRRPEVKDAIASSLKTRLEANRLQVEAVSLTDFDFSESFNAAIEAKVTAEQLKLKADNDLQRIKVEAEQRIASAQAEAEALRLQKQQVTTELIQLRAIENQRAAIDKWDGVLPKITGGIMPFIEVTPVAGEVIN